MLRTPCQLQRFVRHRSGPSVAEEDSHFGAQLFGREGAARVLLRGVDETCEAEQSAHAFLKIAPEFLVVTWKVGASGGLLTAAASACCHEDVGFACA